MLDIVTLRCHKLGVHGTATGHRTLQGPVFWTGSPCPSDKRTLDRHPRPRFPVPSLERATSTTFLPPLGCRGRAGEIAGRRGTLALGLMPFRSLTDRKFTEEDTLRVGQRAAGCSHRKPGPCPPSAVQEGDRRHEMANGAALQRASKAPGSKSCQRQGKQLGTSSTRKRGPHRSPAWGPHSESARTRVSGVCPGGFFHRRGAAENCVAVPWGGVAGGSSSSLCGWPGHPGSSTTNALMRAD